MDKVDPLVESAGDLVDFVNEKICPIVGAVSDKACQRLLEVLKERAAEVGSDIQRRLQPEQQPQQEEFGKTYLISILP